MRSKPHMIIDSTPRQFFPDFNLNEQEWDNFQKVVQNPPKPNKELKKLLEPLTPTAKEGTQA